MNSSTFNLDFGFLGTNHELLDTRKENENPDNTSLISNKINPYTDIINKYPLNSISRFLLKNILFSKKTGIFEVSYIPNISPIDIFMKNCNGNDTIWISCHKQPYFIQDDLTFYVIRDIPELLYLLSKLPSKKTLTVSHLSHLITAHLIAAIEHNKTSNNSIPSINDYKCKLLTKLFQQFILKFNKTILINQFMNSKNNEFGVYMLKTELENGIIGKGSLDLVWQRLINYKFGIYNNTQIDGSMKIVMESGQSNGSMKIFTLYQSVKETEVKRPEKEQENNNNNILTEIFNNQSDQEEMLYDSQL